MKKISIWIIMALVVSLLVSIALNIRYMQELKKIDRHLSITQDKCGQVMVDPLVIDPKRVEKFCIPESAEIILYPSNVNLCDNFKGYYVLKKLVETSSNESTITADKEHD